MRRGLVLGKFMPVHKGHVKLIEFASKHCDQLIVWVCVSKSEPISGIQRCQWLENIFSSISTIEINLFEYDETILPNTSVSSKEVSRSWAEAIAEHLPKIDVIISSEKYGDYLADFMQIEHVRFVTERSVSASEIRKNPYKNWEYIPEIVRPYFYRKVCILGTESTGKSILVQRLAKYFNSDFVSEVGRNIVEQTDCCKLEDLKKIAVLHAKNIIEKDKAMNKILFIDTDITITQSYSRFLFNKNLKTEAWIEEANACDLYLYLDKDAPYIQDGTRLSKANRNSLDEFHKQALAEKNIAYHIIQGSWENRFQVALKIIHAELIAKST